MERENIFKTFLLKGTSLSIIMLFISLYSIAQDIHFSQFYEAPLSRNPALAGIFTGNLRMQVVHRNQWATIDVPFKTSLISIEYKMPVGDNNDYFTTGTSGFKDQMGNNFLTISNFQQSFTYHKSLDDNVNRYLSVGFNGGYYSKRVDPTILSFDSQYGTSGYDAALPTGEIFRNIKRNSFGFTTGISYNSSIGNIGNFFIGGSVWHLLKERSNFLNDSSVQMRKWQYNAGIRAFISSRILLHFESNIYLQNKNKEIMAGGLITYVNSENTNNQRVLDNLSIGAGLFVRLNDAIIPIIKAGYRNISVGFSTDLNTSKLKTISQGRSGSEISFSYILDKKPDTYKQTRCPRF